MKTKKEIQKAQEEIENMRESLFEIITLLGPAQCAKLTGFHRSIFYNFKNDKKVYNSWSAERLINTHNLILDKLNGKN